MNQRILELAKQAGIKANSEQALSPQEQLFAELIVRECTEVCKKEEYYYWRSSEDQDFTPQDCADAIEEHFGVEE
jgi:hypothetical protein